MIKIDEFGLTARDREMVEMMIEFGGKTYLPALHQSVFFGTKEQTIRNRIQVLKKKKLIRYKATGLMSPRNAIVFSSAGRDLAEKEFGVKVNEPNVSAVTTWHNIFEQITWYWLRKVGRNPERAIVSKWGKEHQHTPDLVYFKNEKPIYVEIERTRKRPHRLLEIFERMQADGVAAVLYVFEDEQKMKTLGTKIPLWDKISYVTIPQLIVNAQKGKIGAVKQADFLKSLQMEG